MANEKQNKTKAVKTKNTKKAIDKPEDVRIDMVKTEVIIDSSNIRSTTEAEEQFDLTVRQKLISLYKLQTIDSRIDRIRIIRGELPFEVQDLEDEVARLQTRLENFTQEIVEVTTSIKDSHNFIKQCEILIEKYKEQQNNVRNNREYDFLNKEIEYQDLEIKHAKKKIGDFTKIAEQKEIQLEDLKNALEEREKDLRQKKIELNEIITDTEVDEKKLIVERENTVKLIDERLIFSYSRLRKNAKNGLAVVSIERDACGGCFNQIPPQRQMEIKQHKKIIVCEYCGRIIIDDFIQKQIEQ